MQPKTVWSITREIASEQDWFPALIALLLAIFFWFCWYKFFKKETGEIVRKRASESITVFVVCTLLANVIVYGIQMWRTACKRIIVSETTNSQREKIGKIKLRLAELSDQGLYFSEHQGEVEKYKEWQKTVISYLKTIDPSFVYDFGKQIDENTAYWDTKVRALDEIRRRYKTCL